MAPNDYDDLDDEEEEDEEEEEEEEVVVKKKRGKSKWKVRQTQASNSKISQHSLVK